MIGLVNRFKGKQISIQEFLGQSKGLLGDRLYALLAQGMSSAVRVPPTDGAAVPVPMMPVGVGRPPMPMARPPFPCILGVISIIFKHLFSFSNAFNALTGCATCATGYNTKRSH